MRLHFVIGFSLFVFSLQSYAQLGGRGVYEFLNLPNSARITALGGKQVSLNDGDINMSYNNPSLVDTAGSYKFAVNYINYFAGISWGHAACQINTGKIGNFVVGISYFNYGDFIEADDIGLILGTFTASDYVFYTSYALRLDSNFMVGVNLKPVYSQLYDYTSYGIVSDWAITYHRAGNLFTASLVARNVGRQFTTYTENNFEPMPFELQLGMTQALRHAPFRFSFMFHNLQRFDFTYNLDDDDSGFAGSGDFFESNEKSKAEIFADKTLRHLIAGLEFVPTKSFVFRLGYNYQRVKEMQIEEKLGSVGISWGFGLILKKFHINYGRATYHLAGASNHFSFTLNISELRSK